MLKHIVFLRLKDRSSENIQKAAELLRGIEGKIAQLQSMEVGIDIYHAPRSYDIVFIGIFRSREDERAYQEHPVHQPIKQYMSGVCESIASVDYEVKSV